MTSEKLKPTPGPWIADVDRTYGHPATFTPNIPINPLILGRVIDIPIAKVPRVCEQSDANARLIASAPELLAALMNCREALQIAGAESELKVVEAAIAKATS